MVRWMACAIKKGMFSDERVIKIRDGMTFFVHQDQVRGQIDQQGKVLVQVLLRDNQYWAILPTEDTAIVEVHSEDLEEVPK